MIDASISSAQLYIIVVASIWSLCWKGFALWKAAGQKDKAWFIVLLFVNTLGLLDMLYIFVFSKRSVAKN